MLIFLNHLILLPLLHAEPSPRPRPEEKPSPEPMETDQPKPEPEPEVDPSIKKVTNIHAFQ